MNDVIKIENLKTYFNTKDGVVKAVDDLSLSIKPGHTLGVVGESGSGKSVTSLTIMNLLAASAEIYDGSISFLGKDLINISAKDVRELRGSDVSMIFQEPMSSLNPVHRVGDQVAESILQHEDVSKAEAMERVVNLFDEVGIPDPEQRTRYYPHQMSGGQKQRVMIAMALACNPKLLIADEPTTALDVTIQKQILDLIRELRDQRQMAVLFITHDLGVIAEIADEVLVMYRGKVVEQGDVLDIYENPQHPYTKGLLNCRPRLDTTFKRLPTVSDFMDSVIHEDGSASITEKEVGPDRIDYFENHGRGRLLSKPSELYGYGFDEDPSTYGREATCIDENAKPLLSVNNLKVHFPIRRGLLQRTVGFVKAVDGVSFNVYKGQTLGLVGESGCGKTTTGRAILQLIKPTMGIVKFDGVDVNSRSIHELRKKMQIIFQDPFGSMNPRMTIESMITEPMMIQGFGQSKQDRVDRAASLLEEVGMLPEHLKRYPHEFSGGQRQRICIARALAVEPEFIICDESVSALDVSVQAQVLNLLNDLQESRGLTYIFISHDLSVVKFMADMMAVMKEGHIVEYGPSEAIYRNPKEEYTRSLIEATPCDDLENIRRLVEHRKQLRST
ncbi:MAG: ABC transporter ATP-binding protein [Rhodopirellula sp.]|nr:ABC transporter ATP-binding protein [Rhodopirellula sp.]|tara:strand:+ start:2277 stop:4121 length:1845 start_codon:yes stop_codon:yes gene_type:complete